MITTRVKDIAITIVAVVLLFFGASFGISCWKDRIIKEAKQAEAVNTGDQHIATARDTLRLKDSTVVHERTRYVDARTAVLPAAAKDSSVGNFVKSADNVIAADSAARKAAQVVIDSQSVQIGRLKKFALPRFSVYALGGYDVLAKQPIVQACAELRATKTLSGVACGEAARGNPTPGDAPRVETRAFVAGKLTFR